MLRLTVGYSTVAGQTFVRPASKIPQCLHSVAVKSVNLYEMLRAKRAKFILGSV